MRAPAFLILLSFLFTGCDKSKKYTKRLGGEAWKPTEMSVDGIQETNIPTLKFSECDIYKESCRGSWSNDDGGHAHIAWQFRDEGKTLELINTSDHAHSLQDVRSVEQCIRFSGVYTVVKSKRNQIQLESKISHGSAGQTVKLTLEKIN